MLLISVHTTLRPPATLTPPLESRRLPRKDTPVLLPAHAVEIRRHADRHQNAESGCSVFATKAARLGRPDCLGAGADLPTPGHLPLPLRIRERR